MDGAATCNRFRQRLPAVGPQHRHVQRVADGTYAPGARLNIGALAAEFGTARDTVAHALRLLQDEGKVERYAGLGWYVTGG